MKFTKRTNAKTGVLEAIATTQAVIESIETDSRVNSNGKAFGFFNARVGDNLLTGLAYAKTAEAYPGELVEGSTVVLEALVQDVADGINKNWNLALPQASDVSISDIEAAKEFLNS